MSCRRNVFKDLILPLNQSVHAGLWLDKFLKDQKVPDKEAGEKAKNDLIRDLTKIRVPKGYDISFARWKKMMIEDSTIRLLRGTVNGRIAVGLGDRGSTEIGLSLHHTWGVPYIPGSALKGVAVRAAHQLTDNEQWNIDEDWNNELFGSTDEQGLVHFLDARWEPKGNSFLYKDILTSHHQDYYTNNNKVIPPSDMDSPNPVSFVSTTGDFLIAIQCSDSEWLNIAEEFLKKGLEILGVGSKTNAGYGHMTVEEDKESKAYNDKIKTAENDAETKRKKAEALEILLALSLFERAKKIITASERNEHNKSLLLGKKTFFALKWYDWILSDEIISEHLPKFSELNNEEVLTWLQDQFDIKAKSNNIPTWDKDRKTKINGLNRLFLKPKVVTPPSGSPFGDKNIDSKLMAKVAKEKGKGDKARKVKDLKSLLEKNFGKYTKREVEKAIQLIIDTGKYSNNLIQTLKDSYQLQ